jgi:hypothetical protein
MRGLTAAAAAAIAARDVLLVPIIIHDPAGAATDISADVVRPYSFVQDITTTGSGQIILINPTEDSGQKRYSPDGAGTCPIQIGDRIQIKESIAGDVHESFYGVVRQVAPSTTASGDVVTVTLIDPLALLTYSDLNQNFIHASTAVVLERLDPDMTDDGEHFYAAIKTVDSSTQITYESATGESFLSSIAKSELNYLYNATKKSSRRITAYNSTANTVALTETTDVWAIGDVITNKIYHNIFNTDQDQIKQNSMSLLIRPLLSGRADDPLYQGYSVNVMAGQVVLDAPIRVTDFALYGSYSYFETGYDVEDLIITIATTVDSYGQCAYPGASQADVKDLYQSVEGTGAVDALIGSGTTWYTRYDNIISTLDADDFSITGTKTFVSFDAKTGKLTLSSSGTASAVTCEANYLFYTVQATGVQIGEFWNSDLISKTKAASIESLLKAVAPNYRLFTSGRGKLWGKYFEQKVSADASCTLDAGNVESLQFFQDEDSYTRVKMWAKNIAPKNALSNANLVWSSLVKQAAANVELTYAGVYQGRYVYKIPVQYGLISNFPYPVIKINGGRVDQDIANMVYYEANSGHTNEFNIVYGSSGDDYIAVIELNGSNYEVVPNSIRFSSGPADITDKILFSYSSGRIYVTSSAIFLADIYTISFQAYTFGDNTGSAVDFVIDFKLGRVYLEMTDVDPTTDVVTLDFQYYLVGYPENPNDATLKIPSRKTYLTDGTSKSSAVWSWEENPLTEFTESPEGAVLFVGAWSSVIPIQAIRITAGAFDTKEYSELNSQKSLQCAFNLTVLSSATLVFSAALDAPNEIGEYSYLSATATTIYLKNAKNISALAASGEVWINFEKVHYTSISNSGGGQITLNGCTRGYDGTTATMHAIFLTIDGVVCVRSDATFTEICKELNNIALSTGTTVDVDYTAFGTDFTAGSIMVIVESANPIEFVNRRIAVLSGQEEEAEITVYPVSLQDFRVESDRILVSDIKLAASDSDTTVEDTLDIRAQYGERLYTKSLLTDGVLLTQTQLDTYAKATLQELYKNHARAELVEMVNPSWKMGMTLNIENDVDGIDRNYLVERIQNSDGKLSLSMSYYQ